MSQKVRWVALRDQMDEKGTCFIKMGTLVRAITGASFLGIKPQKIGSGYVAIVETPDKKTYGVDPTAFVRARKDMWHNDEEERLLTNVVTRETAQTPSAMENWPEQIVVRKGKGDYIPISDDGSVVILGAGIAINAVTQEQR